MRLLALPIICTLLLAGCSGPSPDRVFTVAEDAPSEEDAYTGDGYELKVRVVDQDGTPIQGAAVVYFADGEDFFEIDFGASGGATGSGADAAVYYKADFNGYDALAGVRTDSAGMVAVDVEPGLDLNVAAGDVDGMTTEVLPNIAAGSGGGSGTVEIRLYPDTISFTFDVAAGNEVGRAGLMQGTAQVFPVQFSDNDHAEAYQARLHGFDLSATWTNGLDQGADFYVGAGTQNDLLWEGADEQQVPMDGEHTETLHVDDDALYAPMSSIGENGLFLYLMTDWVSLGFGDIPVSITIDAELKGSSIVIQ